MASVRKSRPTAEEFDGPFSTYIALVESEHIEQTLQAQLDDILALLRPLDEKTALTRHPPYTWTINEVVGHISDCERVFAYRALCAARGDTTPLPGFDENVYAIAQHASDAPLSALLTEFEHVRLASLDLLQFADDQAWLRQGIARGTSISVRAWAYIIAGHVEHHLKILHSRLKNAGATA